MTTTKLSVNEHFINVLKEEIPQIDNLRLKTICDQICKLLASERTDRQASCQDLESTPQLSDSLAALFVEATRAHVRSDELIVFLCKYCALDVKTGGVIADRYSFWQKRVEKQLDKISPGMVHLNHVSWYYSVPWRSNLLSEAAAPEFVFNLKCVETGANEFDKEFRASVLQLQDMQMKVKEALKAVEKFSNDTR